MPPTPVALLAPSLPVVFIFRVDPLSLYCCHSVSEQVESISDPLQPTPCYNYPFN